MFNILTTWVNGPGKSIVLSLIPLFVLFKGLELAVDWLVGWVTRHTAGHQMELWKDYKGD